MALLWRANYANGQMVDFRTTARRDAKAARALLDEAIERVRHHRPEVIVTDKAHTYRRMVREIDLGCDPYFDDICQSESKLCNRWEFTR